MTPRQKQALDFIKAFIGEHGYSPSYDEIGGHLGLFGKGGIHRIVMNLRDRGYIKLLKHRARSIEIVDIANDPCGELRRKISEMCDDAEAVFMTKLEVSDLEEAVDEFLSKLRDTLDHA